MKPGLSLARSFYKIIEHLRSPSKGMADTSLPARHHRVESFQLPKHNGIDNYSKSPEKSKMTKQEMIKNCKNVKNGQHGSSPRCAGKTNGISKSVDSSNDEAFSNGDGGPRVLEFSLAASTKKVAQSPREIVNGGGALIGCPAHSNEIFHLKNIIHSQLTAMKDQQEKIDHQDKIIKQYKDENELLKMKLERMERRMTNLKGRTASGRPVARSEFVEPYPPAGYHCSSKTKLVKNRGGIRGSKRSSAHPPSNPLLAKRARFSCPAAVSPRIKPSLDSAPATSPMTQCKIPLDHEYVRDPSASREPSAESKIESPPYSPPDDSCKPPVEKISSLSPRRSFAEEVAPETKEERKVEIDKNGSSMEAVALPDCKPFPPSFPDANQDKVRETVSAASVVKTESSRDDVSSCVSSLDDVKRIVRRRRSDRRSRRRTWRPFTDAEKSIRRVRMMRRMLKMHAAAQHHHAAKRLELATDLKPFGRAGDCTLETVPNPGAGGDFIFRAYEPYHYFVGDPTYLQGELSPKKPEKEHVEAPRFRVLASVVEDVVASEREQTLDDDVYLARHKKGEADEKRRKRWDIQRIRELRNNERLKMGRHAGNAVSWSDPSKKMDEAELRPVSTFYPDPYDVEFIQLNDTVPVCAFGTFLPNVLWTHFRLPWTKKELNALFSSHSTRRSPALGSTSLHKKAARSLTSAKGLVGAGASASPKLLKRSVGSGSAHSRGGRPQRHSVGSNRSQNKRVSKR